MNVEKTSFVAGSKNAKGIVVIIDVFRAFSVACYCFEQGVSKVIPVGDIEDAHKLALVMTDSILVGERHGIKLPGFDYGNSPTEILAGNVSGKTVIHTTHSGTQGIVNAVNADEVLTGALVNARATADYIKSRKPKQVTLVRMGLEARIASDEDDICADYLESLLLDQPFEEHAIKNTLAKSPFSERFFDPEKPWNPETDFHLCLELNRFNFVLKAQKNEDGLLCLEKIAI